MRIAVSLSPVALEAGMTAAAVARRYNTSHQTILHIRDARKRS